MTEHQRRSIKIALNFCRDDIELSSRGPLDYNAAAKQIAALPGVQRIRELVEWVLEYERNEIM